jgi:hypothetical protein
MRGTALPCCDFRSFLLGELEGRDWTGESLASDGMRVDVSDARGRGIEEGVEGEV